MATITQPITVDAYDRMIADGTIDEDDRVELWDGVIVPKMPKYPPHRVGTTKVAETLEGVVPAGWYVSRENAVVVGPRSKPEPYVSVVRETLKYDTTRDPTAADCCLLVEFADSSLDDDQNKKLEGYARAGIPVYWIANLRDSRIEVYTDPDPATGTYRKQVDYLLGQDLPVVIDGQEVGRIAVANLLP
jgi:Uma2 family endonuclease